MQEDVLVVMSGGIEAENVDVDGVGDPGERVPVAGITVREGPYGGVQRQAVFNMRIVNNEFGIVDVDVENEKGQLVAIGRATYATAA